MVADNKNNKILRSSATGSTSEPENLGLQLAEKLFDMGAEELLAEVGE